MKEVSSLNAHIKQQVELAEFKAYKRKKQQAKAKKKYNSENYSSLQVHLDKNLVAQYKALLEKLSLKQTDVLRFFVLDFLKDYSKYIKLMNCAESESDFNYDAHISNITNSNLNNRISMLMDEESIIKFFHNPYECNQKRQLLPLAKWLGYDVDGKISRSDLVYLMHRHYIDQLKN